MECLTPRLGPVLAVAMLAVMGLGMGWRVALLAWPCTAAYASYAPACWQCARFHEGRCSVAHCQLRALDCTLKRVAFHSWLL